MIIEDPETFKVWLTARLEPLCDADPAALAKYVYALVKKDKPIEDLKASMIEQLEVFLQKETHGFVDLLFRTLESQEYNMNPDPPEPVLPINSEPMKGILSDIDLREPLPIPSEEIDRKIISKDSEKDDRSRRARKRGSTLSPERRRSRSRSYERRRSRSRDRDRARAWRNKSPPSRRYERRRTYSKSPVRRHSRSRTPTVKKGSRYRNRSPPRSLSRTRSRTRSRSPIDNHRKDVSTTSPQRDTGHGDTDLRLNPASQNIQSVVAVPPEVQTFSARRCRSFDEEGYCMRGDLCPYDHGSDPVILEDVAGIYNGSGLQPPLQPPAHPPPIHANVPIRPPPPITTNLSEYNPDAPSMEPRVWRGPQLRVGPMMRNMSHGGIMGRGGFGHGHQRELINVVTGSGPPYRHPRPNVNTNIELVNDGRMDGGKRVFDYNRLGANRASRGNVPSGNSSLQLKKVPIGVNNITHLNNHFSKFGKILNIQVGFEGDPESALITFSTHTEANIAYKSTEAVLNNRFIRVHWYNSNNSSTNNNNNNVENKQENTTPASRPSILERLGAPPPKVLNNNLQQPPPVVQQEEKVTLANNNLSKTLYIPSAMKKDTILDKKAQVFAQILKKKEEEENLIKEKRKKQEEARKESLKRSADLRKRKQELLEKQLNQQKLLIEKLESSSHSGDQKNTIMTTIKSLQESIENLRKDLATAVEATLTKSKSIITKEHLDLVKKTREEIQKELLDAELDLFNREQEGKDTLELKKKVAEIKMKAISLGVPSVGKGSANTTRGRGTFRARGRGRGSRFSFTGSYDHNVVDHRPTKLLVSGYEQDDKADVLAHFAQFGEIVDYLSDDATPSLVMNFKSRKEAEVALAKGKNFQDRLLSVTWASPNHNIRTGIPTKNNRTPLIVPDENIEDILEEGDDEELVSLLSPSALLQDDDDDDDGGERSWRR